MSPEHIIARLRAAGCVFAEDEAALLTEAARTPIELDALVARRAAGLPLEHVLGWVDFCGIRITVEPGVFVPRRRTELLARQAAALTPPGGVAVDLCCGSGAVAAVVAGRGPAAIHAVDIDPVAVRCARRNLGDGHVHLGDLDTPLPAALRGRVDVLVANAPYVPSDAIDLLPPEARLHEPRVALDGGPDGLDVLRRVAGAAPGWLAPGGQLLVEAGENQVSRLLDIMTGAGLSPRQARSAELGAIVIVGTRTG